MKNDLHHRMMVTQSRFYRAITHKTRKKGLKPGQPKVLEFLLENDGCTQKEIGRGCVLDKSTVTGLLFRMAEAGLLIREEGEADRRESRIRLTARGKELAHEVKAICHSVDEKAWTGVPAGEREAFLRVLVQIGRNLAETDEPGEEV